MSTLLNAPAYDPARDRRRRNLLIALLVLIIVIPILAWYFWDWPETHRVNQFFDALQAKNYERAYALWTADPNWKQHPDQHKNYGFGQFEADWGPAGDYGTIKSHKIVMAKSVPHGTGVVVAVDVNGRKEPTFLWVEKKDHSIGFSPVELQPQ